MEGVKNPFAVRDGNIILIEDLSENERGLNCHCKCPVCDGEFIARMGDAKIHHFAHSKDACSDVLSYTSGLYKLIRQILNNGSPFYIPALVISYSFPYNGVLTEDNISSYINFVREDYDIANKIVISPGRYIKFDNAELCVDNKNQIQALELKYMKSKMALKVMPPDTVCKISTVSPHKNMATLAIDFTYDANIIQTSDSKQFQEYLLSVRLDKRWIYNPKIKKAYPQIISLSRAAHETYLERVKKIKK